MATRTKTNANRTTLVDGCGTILKTNRLSGGYKLVKRKRVVGAKATAPAKRIGRPAKRKAGRPKKAVTTITEKVVMTAPAKRRGRPAKVKMVASVTAPAKRRGRPAKAKMMVSVKPTAKRRGRRASAKA